MPKARRKEIKKERFREHGNCESDFEQMTTTTTFACL